MIKKIKEQYKKFDNWLTEIIFIDFGPGIVTNRYTIFVIGLIFILIFVSIISLEQ